MESDTDGNQREAGGTGGDWQDEPASGELGATGSLGAWGVRDYRDPDSYWRRRFLILAAGFAVLCGMTWGLSALLGPARSNQAGGLGHAGTALPTSGKLPSAPRRLPAGAMATSAPGKGAGQPAPSRAAGAASPAACPPGSIVLSLLTSQARYSPGQRPQFEVYAVSTAPGACDLAYGPSVVRVMVTRGGHVVWDSAACGSRGEGSAPGPMRFTRGVPRVATVSWTGPAGTAGCAGPARAAAAGTFAVVATADGESSPVRTFTLTR
jgi:hypothetical protein